MFHIEFISNMNSYIIITLSILTYLILNTIIGILVLENKNISVLINTIGDLT